MGNSESVRKILSETAAILIELEDQPGKIYRACDRFYQLLAEIANLDINNDLHRDPLHLAFGKSIGPLWAAMCIRDFLRTKKFVRGLYLAVEAARQKFPGIPVHVLYAGTGPFAALALPLTALFTPAELQFTFLEIHPESYRMLQLVIDSCGITPFVCEQLLTDASLYLQDQNRPVHILLTETMQSGLKTEPQVAIAMNLARQLHPDGIMVPEKIRVHAGLLRLHGWQSDDFGSTVSEYVLLKELLVLDRSFAEAAIKSTAFSPIKVSIPANLAGQYNQLCLFTEIQIYGNEILKNGESPLSSPHKILDFKQLNKVPAEIEFQYLLEESPGFSFRMVDC